MVSSSGIRLPGSSTDDVAVSYDANNRVSSVVTGGVTTAYGFSGNGNDRTVTVTRGDLPARSYVFRIDTLQIKSESWKTDANGPLLTRSYDYSPDTNDPGGTLLKQVSEPDGRKTVYTYDTRGNVTKTRLVSQTPNTPPDLVTTAVYDQTCTNAVTCNRPNSTTDVRGKNTDFTYDAVHGGVLTVTGPAPDPASPTVRPMTKYDYAQLDSNGAASTSGAWMLTKVTTCTTASTCAGTANEQITELGYGANLNLTTVTRRSGDNAVTATTTTTYDAVGNVIAVDGPLAGSDDITRTRYDVLRRVIGTVGPDPDGSGARLPRATRTTYNTDGTVQSVEQGTDSTPAAGDFKGFTSLQQVTSSYDGYHRKVKEVLTAGGTTFAVGQQSYDGLGRLDCSVTRMDPAQWSSQSDACAPQITGPNGADRVVRRNYDTLDRVTTVTNAYGAAEAVTESTSYASNGKVGTVTDGNGNVTATAYDGFDRPWRTCFQTTTSAACAGTPADYQQVTYADNGDVKSVRLRDGQTIGYGYDDLGRLKSKDRPNGFYWQTDQSYGYDLTGRLTSASDDGWHVLGFGYDALGRRTSQSDNWSAWGNASFQYDATGRRTRLTWNDGNYVNYDYRVTGEMKTIRNAGGAALVTFDYDDLGRRTGLTRATGTSTAYGFDAASRLTSLSLAGGNQPNTLGFDYNPAQQITSR